MTDLLQTAVNTGTGKAAQIGRPVAGKTGTTARATRTAGSSAFRAGITTGVWMGRDDAQARSAGCRAARAPAKAFADFMRVAVAQRPVEQFDTEVTLPEWQLEPTRTRPIWASPAKAGFVDENGMPIELPDDSRPPETAGPTRRRRPKTGPVLDQQWIEEQTGRRGPGDDGAAPKNGGQSKIITVPKAAPPVVRPSQQQRPPSDGAND